MSDEPSEFIAFDHECVACNYNLRGLRPVGRCPECGHDIATSLIVPRGVPRVGLSVRYVVLGVLFGLIQLMRFREDQFEPWTALVGLGLELAAAKLAWNAHKRRARISPALRIVTIVTLCVSLLLATTMVLGICCLVLCLFGHVSP